MLDLNPNFYIYEPPLLMFGGIEVIPPYTSSNLAQEMSKIHRNVRSTIYQAYSIYMRTQVPNKNTVSTTVLPLEATIDEKCRDYHINRRELVTTISQMLFSRGRDTGLVHHNNGFYVVHKLKEKFDPPVMEWLLKKIDAAMIKLVYKKFRISSIISDDLLRVDAEILPTDTYVI